MAELGQADAERRKCLSIFTSSKQAPSGREAGVDRSKASYKTQKFSLLLLLLHLYGFWLFRRRE